GYAAAAGDGALGQARELHEDLIAVTEPRLRRHEQAVERQVADRRLDGALAGAQATGESRQRGRAAAHEALLVGVGEGAGARGEGTDVHGTPLEALCGAVLQASASPVGDLSCG